MLTLRGGGLAVYVKSIKSGAFAWLLEDPPLVGNASTLLVRGNIY